MFLVNSIFPKAKFLEIIGLCVAASAPAVTCAQVVVATIPVGTNPTAIAINTVTNKIYVANSTSCGPNGPSSQGSVTIIDGDTDTTTSVPAGVCPVAIAVNPVTNEIYVANFGHMSLTCGSCVDYGSITIIDGPANTGVTITDPNAKFPHAVAVNSTTNKIYVANNFSNNVTVLDGATSSITDVSTIGRFPWDIAVNPVTNKIYVTSFNPDALGATTTVTVIDGVTGNPAGITDPQAVDPLAVAVNPVTNKVYIANFGDLGQLNGTNVGSVTVVDGATASTRNIVDPSAWEPHAVAVMPTTDKIYVSNVNNITRSGNATVTVISGDTNSFLDVTDPNAAAGCAYQSRNVAADAAGKIYVANCSSGNITVIDGASNLTTTIADPNASNPVALAINPATDKIYVVNSGSNNLTVIDGGGTPTSFTLSVKLAGNGSGTVTSNPAGIDCGNSCSASFTPGTLVTLTASPASGSTFSGWSGLCSGTGPCSIAMTGDESPTATFAAGPPPDFSLTAASATLTTQRGAQVIDVITIAPLNGGSFGNPIQLSCAVTGSTPLATCSLSSTSVTPGANSVTSTLTITAPTQLAQLTPSGDGRVSTPIYAVLVPIPLALIGLGLTFGKLKQRRHSLWLVSGLLATLVVLQAGCGGGSSSQSPPLNYTVTVTATSGTLQHTTQVTVTVP